MGYIPAGVTPEELPPYPGYGFETPASIGCWYGMTAFWTGCNPNNSSAVSPTGGSKTIAIVDAYDDPSAQSDLAWFSLQFNVPLSLTQIEVVWAQTANSSCYSSYVPTDYSGGWELEESLDIEWAHAMAPSATIYLVEACSNFDTDLQQAVLVANNLVNCGKTGIGSGGVLNTGICGTTHNPGEISISWGGMEFIGENASDSCANLDDSCFITPNIVYFAAAGDSPGVIWPGTSPNVVSVGGASHRRNSSTFNGIAKAAWVFTGGGPSAIEALPTYQNISAVTSVCGTTYRCAPDASFLADPYTGVYVYDTFPVYGFVEGPWWIVGGTSLSTPAMAGIVNNAASRSGTWAASTSAELTTIYSNYTNTADWRDVIYDVFCGPYNGYPTGFDASGYDLCTGVGTPMGFGGK
jgi:subtilase family serine protease